MTNPTTDRLAEVLQCDREAAAANILTRLKYEHGGEQPWMDASTVSMRMGEQDHHWEVQAFARHRLAAIQSQQAEIGAAYEEIGRLKEKLTQSERHIEDVNAHLPKYQEALRQLKIGQAEIERKDAALRVLQESHDWMYGEKQRLENALKDIASRVHANLSSLHKPQPGKDEA